MVPLGLVVARPHGAEALRAGEERPREDERPLAQPLGLAVPRAFGDLHSVQIMHVAMLNIIPMQRVLLHGDLRSIEHRRLVHVVPSVQDVGGAFVLVKRKLVAPVLEGVGVEKVQVRDGTRPAPAFVRLAASPRLLDVEALRLRVLVHVVVVVAFDVWIDDGDHFAALRLDVVLHGFGGGEQRRVPREVLLPVSVLNVQPDGVVRNVMLVEPCIDCLDIVLVLVVPAALVVAQRKLLRHGLEPGQ
mmetsp:Transcript_10951/g.20113  ORF Transcript_10951/g.20113 Transcript_10951/m.20113 type:complete len:245 (-) Transcript_10951:1953-2687(-)